MKFIVILFVVAMVFLQAEGRTFTRCQLVQELRSQGFPKSKLRQWVCIVENASGRTTSKIGKVNRNGSVDYGLFQINDKWCSKTSTPGKDCNVTCADLLTDDITKAAACAKKIYQRHAFNEWIGCRNLPDISSC